MATALVSGTVVPQSTEAHIVAGGRVIIITLDGARWAITLGQNNALTQALINGITAGASPATGWNLVVKPGLTFANVIRTNDLICTITLPAFVTYNISANETITVVIPDTAITLGPTIGGAAGGLVLPKPIATTAFVITSLVAAAVSDSEALTVPVATVAEADAVAIAAAVSESMTLSIVTPTALDDATQVYERYQIGDDESLLVYGVRWESQTITPSVSHTLNRVAIKVARGGIGGLPGTITVSIRATAAGLPTGADLVSLTFDGNLLDTAATGQFRQYVMPGVALTAATKYAIVVRATGGDVNNHLVWREDATSPTYAGGSRCSSVDSGGTWAADTTKDFMFDEGNGVT